MYKTTVLKLWVRVADVDFLLEIVELSLHDDQSSQVRLLAQASALQVKICGHLKDVDVLGFATSRICDALASMAQASQWGPSL